MHALTPSRATCSRKWRATTRLPRRRPYPSGITVSTVSISPPRTSASRLRRSRRPGMARIVAYLCGVCHRADVTAALRERDRNGRNQEHEQDQADPAEDASAGSERRHVVERRSVVEADEEEEQRRPHEPVQRLRRNSEQDQPAERQEPDHPVVPSEERVRDATAVELAQREEIERGDEEAGPARHRNGMEEDVHAGWDRAELQVNEQLEEQ